MSLPASALGPGYSCQARKQACICINLSLPQQHAAMAVAMPVWFQRALRSTGTAVPGVPVLPPAAAGRPDGAPPHGPAAAGH